MRPRLELVVAFVLVMVLGFAAVLLGSREAKTDISDFRHSSFVPGPHGTRALADALRLVGVRVDRFRRHSVALADLEADGALFMVLEPSRVMSFWDTDRITGFAEENGDLLLAGFGAEMAMGCYGYAIDSVPTADGPSPVEPPAESWNDRPSSRRWLTELVPGDCAVTPAMAVDTLLINGDGAPVFVRLDMPGEAAVFVLADAELFSSRTLRETDAGPFVVGLVADAYDWVIFDEYHHGFTQGGSVLSVVVDWMARTPLGWAIWQVTVVGLMALLLAAIRFGPVRRLRTSRRRSHMEHVHALAAALAASRGQDVAVRLMVEGLRRRLSVTGQPLRAPVEPWLDTLEPNVRTPVSRIAVRTLQQLIRGPAPSDGVLLAANAVEDVWQDMRR
jgi:hypothetical protein